jgi:hypothetical protein
MSHAAGIHPADFPQRPATRAWALGWGISLLAHALAVAWLWHALLPRRTDNDAAPVKRIEVRLAPIAPAVPSALPLPAPEPASPRARSTPAHAAPTPPPARRQPPAIVVPAAPIVTAREPATETPASTGSGTDAPMVDLAAARAVARRIAREDARSLVALPKRKPVVDPNADHHVVDPLERARRVDCQTARAESTNLLANVVMLAVDVAKNAIDDSGCKW